jgi:hypothetical protein
VGAEGGGALGADRVEHEANVVHVLLEGLAARPAVGQAVAEPVHHDQPRERREPAQELGQVTVLPQQAQVGRVADQEDQVKVRVAEDLVGDVVPVGATGGPKRIARVYGDDSSSSTTST